MLFIHGTDYESAMNIVNNGLMSGHNTVWSCSRDDMLYCRKSQDEDGDENEYLCIESGQIAAAYKNSMSTCIGIVNIDIPDDIADDIVEDDNSCENTYGCYQILIDDILENLDKIKISVDIYGESYVPYLRPFYISNVSEQYMVINDPLLKTAIDVIQKSSSFLEEIFYHGSIVEHYEL